MNFDIKFYNFGINKNDYFIKNIKKFKKQDNIRIKNITYDKNTNEEIYSNIDKYDMFIISKNETINFTKFVLYPVVLYNPQVLIISSILLQQINYLPESKDFEDMIDKILINIKYFIGGVMTDKINKMRNISENEIYTNKFAKSSLERNPHVIKLNISSSVRYYDNCEHGWLTKWTKENLKYVIAEYKPKNILELGAWYGLSSRFIIENAPDANLYTFDKFQNLCLSPYKIDHRNVLNEFYFSYPRMETFYKNITNTNTNKSRDIYAIREDAYKSLDIMKENNIEIDMIFIDFIKKTKNLIEFLKKCINYYPKAIIVGDDYVFETVQNALLHFVASNNVYFACLPMSYIISPYEIKDYDKLYTLVDKSKIHKENIKNNILENEQDYYLYIDYLIKNAKIDEIYDTIVKYKLDMNKPFYANDNTIYHLLAELLYKLEQPEKITKFYKYQKPKRKKNILLLTYEDYLHHKINFS